MSKVKKGNLISVIIPAYNEERTISNSISAIEHSLSSIGKPFEVLVVNDSSNDATLSIMQNIIRSKKHPNVRLVSYAEGPSRRENLAKSFRLLKGAYIVLLDMDLSMDLKHIKDMIYWLDNGYDMAIPNRYHKESHIKRNFYRHIRSRLYNAFIRVLFRTGFKDNICGFKGFKSSAIMQLVKEAGIDRTGTRGVFWDTEIIIRAKNNKFKIKEIPINYKDGKNSALSFKREIKMLPYIIKFWLGFSKG